MGNILLLVVVFAASFAIFYSVRTRQYRNKENMDIMRFYNAKTNIAMGIMLVSMALIQLFTFPETTGWRIGVGIVFLLLGAFNFMMGLRNYNTFAPKVYKEKK
ncbi:YtpI family protein [Caldalkalibacillus salinus]|uniref:YtpI family protein n=1 Tax=Caldalkalibacillus salinus TaxID=2803787 RepID=UPI001922E316|nr:YtpI family protein [Caldalkalibacillus salinus]